MEFLRQLYLIKAYTCVVISSIRINKVDSVDFKQVDIRAHVAFM
jgi:hypothetical protein